MLLEIDDDDAAVLFSTLPRLLSTANASHPQQVALARVHRRLAETGERMNLRWVRLDDDMEMGSPVLSEDLGRQTRSAHAVASDSPPAASASSGPGTPWTPSTSSICAGTVAPSTVVAPMPTASSPRTGVSDSAHAAAAPPCTPNTSSRRTPSSPPKTWGSMAARVICPLPRRSFRELTNTPGRDKENFSGDDNLCRPTLPISPFVLPGLPLSGSQTLPSQDVFSTPLEPSFRLLSPLRVLSPLSPLPPSPSSTMVDSE
ncbi:hypothetical protein B0H13DRAFT_365338 [Mycena leptocephala]|nr:hypothetical protein B0H13DRAFT_365338 [Mycena leptocephala]